MFWEKSQIYLYQIFEMIDRSQNWKILPCQLAILVSKNLSLVTGF